MTTVINNPGDSGEGLGIGIIVAVLVVMVAVVLFFVYGLPAIRNSKTGESSTTNIKIEVPAPDTAVPLN